MDNESVTIVLAGLPRCIFEGVIYVLGLVRVTLKRKFTPVMLVIVHGKYLAWMPSINKNAIKGHFTGYGRQTISQAWYSNGASTSTNELQRKHFLGC